MIGRARPRGGRRLTRHSTGRHRRGRDRPRHRRRPLRAGRRGRRPDPARHRRRRQRGRHGRVVPPCRAAGRPWRPAERAVRRGRGRGPAARARGHRGPGSSSSCPGARCCAARWRWTGRRPPASPASSRRPAASRSCSRPPRATASTPRSTSGGASWTAWPTTGDGLGLELCEARPATDAEIAAARSTWARRLGLRAGRPRACGVPAHPAALVRRAVPSGRLMRAAILRPCTAAPDRTASRRRGS